MKSVLILSLLIISCYSHHSEIKEAKYTFPKGFKFGVATASYQVEGAWKEAGKGPNIWDHVTHTNPAFIDDERNGDIACDTYHKTKEDVQLLKQLGVDFYRFSLSWSRLLPRGFATEINAEGVRYYNELIDELLANDIKPMVTLFHWDTPQNIQELGGWPNPRVADYFTDYARVVFEQFGDRVKDWITFNEPNQICQQGYAEGSMAPGYLSKEMGGYWCTHTLLIAHGQTYRLYERDFKKEQQGRVGITIDSVWHEPISDSLEDIAAAERVNLMDLGWYMNAIYSENGDYPNILRERVDQFSKEEGFLRSRLPHFTPEEIEMIKGSFDFFGLNHYTTRLTGQASYINNRPSHTYDKGARYVIDPSWDTSAADWLFPVPWGLRKTLEWIKNTYNNPEVIITENGFADPEDAGVNDCNRVKYYNEYLEEVLKAIHDSGCKVTGYTAWSFLDNFEWRRGYTQRFGLYHVDFNDITRPRTPKLSSFTYSNIIRTKKIDWDYVPADWPQCDFANKEPGN